jgi:hypothetical protein
MAAAARLLQNPALAAAMQNPTSNGLSSALSGLNPALAAQLHASTAAQMGNSSPVSGIDISNLTAMHAMLQKQNEIMSMNSEPSAPADDIKIEEVESDIPTVHPESPVAHSPAVAEMNKFETEMETKPETAPLDLFKHELPEESSVVTMQE